MAQQKRRSDGSQKIPGGSPARSEPGTPASPAATRPASRDSDPRRFMREAAWSRMFGRIETRNPFTR